MTKKDYILIAEAIRDVYDYQKESDGKGSKALKQGAIEVTVVNIADALRHDNPRFDSRKFVKACGIENSIHLLAD